MGREVRKVPPDWQHPKDEEGHYVPLLAGDPVAAIADWDSGKALWEEGFRNPWDSDEKIPRESDCTFEEWAGERPKAEWYMPQFTPGTATHFAMYETCSEGTPISPAFATAEELARYLADAGASAFGQSTATYEQWLAVCRGGWAPSMVITNGQMLSGVAFAARDKN